MKATYIGKYLNKFAEKMAPKKTILSVLKQSYKVIQPKNDWDFEEIEKG